MIRRVKIGHSLRISAITALVGLSAGVHATAGAVVYEPFDYAGGAVNGKAGGTGMSGAWISSGSNPYSVVTPGLSLGSLPVAGGAVRRTSAPGGAEMHRGITSEIQTALTGDGSTVWFSVLVRNDRFSVGNEDGAFVLGSGAFDVQSSDGQPNTIEGGTGEGIGLQLNGRYPNDNTMDIYAYAVDSSGDYRSAAKLDNDSSVSTFLVAGRITWAPNGSSDTVLLFNITDPAGSEPADGTAFASLALDLDQAQFDTLAIGNRQVSALDEIRLGATFYDVMGSEPPPAAGTVILVR